MLSDQRAESTYNRFCRHVMKSKHSSNLKININTSISFKHDLKGIIKKIPKTKDL